MQRYKEIRPVVQFVDLYRLVSPYDGKSVASLMYCSKDKARAVFFWWKLEQFQGMSLPRFRMAGLDPARRTSWSSRVLLLEAVD